MKTVVLLAAAFLLLAGCAAESTRTATKTVTTTVYSFGRQEEQAPTVTFSKDSNPSRPGGTLTVVSVQGAPREGIAWSDLDVDTTGCALPDGTMEPGDVIVCTTDGPHRISYVPTNSLLYTAAF